MSLVFFGCSKSGEISAIEEAIRLELEKPKGELPQEHYLGLKKLSVYRTGRPVTDISLLNEMPNLEELDFASGDISDPAPLAKLRVLALNGNRIKDTSPLSGLKSLKWVNLMGNPISEQAIEDLKKALPGCKIEHD